MGPYPLQDYTHLPRVLRFEHRLPSPMPRQPAPWRGTCSAQTTCPCTPACVSCPWLPPPTAPGSNPTSQPPARRYRYKLLVRRFLSNGTTTATYFGSLHLTPNKVLVDEIVRLGQRAVVGKVRGAGRTT